MALYEDIREILEKYPNMSLDTRGKLVELADEDEKNSVTMNEAKRELSSLLYTCSNKVYALDCSDSYAPRQIMSEVVDGFNKFFDSMSNKDEDLRAALVHKYMRPDAAPGLIDALTDQLFNIPGENNDN